MDEDVEDISTIMNRIAGGQQNHQNLSVYNLMDEWFNPKQSLMKHVIVIQMIACVIVGFFLLALSGNSLSANELMLAVFGFMMFIAGAFGVYGKL